MSKTFKNIVTEVKKVGSNFSNKWDLKTHYIDLVEEVGELGNAILVESGNKSIKRKRADLQDSFADIFFELILMAEVAQVDLETSLTHMLKELRTRQQNKEYNNK